MSSAAPPEMALPDAIMHVFMSEDSVEEKAEYLDDNVEIHLPKEEEPLFGKEAFADWMTNGKQNVKWALDWEVIDVENGGLVYARTGKQKVKVVMTASMRQCVLVMEDKILKITVEKL
mmetsp:Transcript_1673/g.7303  ORF Transcript_1673/g.7303 Transcript_1673/m.7303 type:complete len:118 (+) Transcript_1673:193-546(+)